MNIIKICNRRFTRERKELLFTIWRLKYIIVNELKFKLRDEAIDTIKGAGILRDTGNLRDRSIDQSREEKKGALASTSGGTGFRSTKKVPVRYDFDDERDIGIATSLADGVLRTLKYMRERANGIIFEIFIRSANSAEQKKTYVLVAIFDIF